MMRNLDQFELWAHGTRFVVRRVGAVRSYGGTPAPSGYVLFGPYGFIARLPRRNLKRWARYFGLKYLVDTPKKAP